jgi:type I restriction enzyme, S subunit
MNKSTFVNNNIFSDIPTDWKVEPFKDWVDFQEGPGIGAIDFKKTGVPLLRLKSINDNFATLNGCDYLDPIQVEKKWDHFRLRKRDLLLSSSASLGRVSEVGNETVGAVAYTGIIRMRPLKKDITQEFIKYFLQSNFFKRQIELSATGSVIKHYGPLHLRQMAIVIPPLSEQKIITNVLDLLNKKIEINQKMNETLQKIIESIFKSWFIHFDPVRAKAEGRSTGLSKKVSDLFTNSFKESDLGKIPKDWSASTFSDVMKIQGGFAFKSKDFRDKGFSVIKIKNINEDGTVNVDDCDRVSNVNKKLDNFLLKKGDVIIAMTGATVGKVGMVSTENQKLYLNQRVGRLRSTTSKRQCWYSVLLLSSNYTKKKIESIAYGSAQPNISSKDIESISNVTPPKELLDPFNLLVSPLFEKILFNLKENKILLNLLNTFIPELISGKFRINLENKSLKVMSS